MHLTMEGLNKLKVLEEHGEVKGFVLKGIARQVVELE